MNFRHALKTFFRGHRSQKGILRIININQGLFTAKTKFLATSWGHGLDGT